MVRTEPLRQQLTIKERERMARVPAHRERAWEVWEGSIGDLGTLLESLALCGCLPSSLDQSRAAAERNPFHGTTNGRE